MNESTLVDSLRTLSRYEAGSNIFNGLQTKNTISVSRFPTMLSEMGKQYVPAEKGY